MWPHMPDASLSLLVNADFPGYAALIIVIVPMEKLKRIEDG